MTSLLKTTTIALAALAAASGAALAGGEAYPRPAVPVPAPMLTPEFAATWYLRGDIGYSVGAAGELTGERVNVTPLGDLDDVAHGGIGFGRYLTPNMRLDFTADFRPSQRVTRAPTGYYETVSYAGAPGGVNYWQVNRDENTRIENHTLLANLYYDFGQFYGFKPYVGAGLGISIHNMERAWSETATCLPAPNPSTDCGLGTQASPVASGSAQSTGYGFAFAFMTGMGWALSEDVTLDVGYRYLWQDGTIRVIAPSSFGSSVIRQDDRQDHELRTGLRININ